MEYFHLPLKHWIHFLLSSLWPPTSNMLLKSHRMLYHSCALGKSHEACSTTVHFMNLTAPRTAALKYCLKGRETCGRCAACQSAAPLHLPCSARRMLPSSEKYSFSRKSAGLSGVQKRTWHVWLGLLHYKQAQVSSYFEAWWRECVFTRRRTRAALQSISTVTFLRENQWVEAAQWGMF